VGQIEFDLDEETKILKFFHFRPNSRYIISSDILEIIVGIIQLVIVLQCKKLTLDSFPITAKDFSEIINFFEHQFPDRLTFGFIQTSESHLSNIYCDIKIPKRTHFVQQAYLRNFSSNRKIWEKVNKKKARIYCFDKQTQAVVEGNSEIERLQGQRIETVAQQDYFYSLHFEISLATTLEKYVPPILKRIISTNIIDHLSESEKSRVCQYLLLQWNRTEEARLDIQENMENTILQVTKMIDKELPEDIGVRVKPTYLRIVHENETLDLIDPSPGAYLVPHLLTFKWSLVRAKKFYWFYTSDNPVILYNSSFEKIIQKEGDTFFQKHWDKVDAFVKSKGASKYIRFSGGFETGRAPKIKGVEIYFPISPKLCLCLIDQQPDTKRLSVGGINREIILQSKRYIFSHKKNFDYVNKILERYPECIDRDGRRSVVKYRDLSRKL